MKQKDIDKGVPCTPCKCPVARAIRRAVGHKLWSGVGPKSVGLSSELRKVRLPKKVRQFIWAFDRNEIVQPFSFTLEI